MNPYQIPNEYFEHIACPVCEGKRFNLFLKIKCGDLKQKPSLDYSRVGITADTELFVKECRDCRLVFVNPRIRARFEKLIYNECKAGFYRIRPQFSHVTQEFFSRARGKKISHLRPLQIALAHVKSSGPLKLFDFGCGFGYSMSLAGELGIDAYGVDIDCKRLDFCRELGLNVCAPQDFERLFPKVEADIVLWQSNIEHLIDLQAAASFLRQRCKDGTVLYVNGLTPSIIRQERRKGTFVKAHFVEHINYFPIRTLDRFMGNHGFTPLRMANTSVVKNCSELLRFFARFLISHYHGVSSFGHFERVYRYHV